MPLGDQSVDIQSGSASLLAGGDFQKHTAWRPADLGHERMQPVGGPRRQNHILGFGGESFHQQVGKRRAGVELHAPGAAPEPFEALQGVMRGLQVRNTFKIEYTDRPGTARSDGYAGIQPPRNVLHQKTKRSGTASRVHPSESPLRQSSGFKGLVSGRLRRGLCRLRRCFMLE